MSKKQTVAQRTRLAVIRSMFMSASSAAANIGNQQVVNMVQGLGGLDNPSGAQVDEAIGLIDGVLELEKRYGNRVKAERVEVAGGDEEDAAEVDDTKARAALPTQATSLLIQTRVWLSAASVLLHHKDRPVANQDMVPVPDKGMPDTDGNRATAAPGRRGE